jgi:hypothetical protein
MRILARTVGALLKFLYQNHNILIVLWAFGTMAVLAATGCSIAPPMPWVR